jgi:hypothetical protein
MILHLVSIFVLFQPVLGGKSRDNVPVCPYTYSSFPFAKVERRVDPLCDESVLLQIEELRRELNERYKLLPDITPELLELSVKLDRLLNKLYLHP